LWPLHVVDLTGPNAALQQLAAANMGGQPSGSGFSANGIQLF